MPKIGDPPFPLSFKGKRCMVTGAAGFLGKRLSLRLLKLSAERVHMFDIREPNFKEEEKRDILNWEERTRFFCGDIRKYENVQAAAKGCHVIIHIASYGMSGREMLQKDMVWAINVEGTRHIVKASEEEESCSGIVYTSTCNVVFHGQKIEGGDSKSVERADDSEHHDNYSRTKSIAEQIVLSARTPSCALRSTGIYGDEEERHFPRIIQMMERGLFQFTIGGRDTLVEWVYVDNLVYAHLLAAAHLLFLGEREKGERERGEREEGEREGGERGGGLGIGESEKVKGGVFYVSDWEPVNQYTFLEPLANALGFSVPSIDLPVGLMYFFGWSVEWTHYLLSPFVNFQPLLTRAEVLKVSVTHWFLPDEARDILGYHPIVPASVGNQRMVEYFKKKYPPKKKESNFFFPLLIGAVVILLLSYFFFLF